MLHAIGEAYGRLPSELLERDMVDLAFDAEVLIKARDFERRAVKEGSEQAGQREIIIDESRRMHDEWVATLSPEVREKLGV